MTTSREDELEALRQTLLAEGIRETADPDTSLGRAEPLLEAPRTSQLPRALLTLGGEADYRLEYVLGEGGMATVWLAQQRALLREVAVKRAHTPTEGASRQLLEEAIITGQLEHPNIVPVHAVVQDAEGPAVVMKRIGGRSWDELIDTRAPLERHIEVVLQVCQACAFAHSRGVLHRDIKPDNVMIGDFGEVYLLDWGVARRLADDATNRLAGTPAYMPPEMARGRSDVRSDVFLLGASLHHAATGELRHSGDTVLATVAAAMRCEAYAYGPDVPEELAAILQRACARDPDARYQTVNELRDALLRFREHRAASSLVATARARLQQLTSLARDPAQADYGRAQSLFTETRFAFEQAREVWPEHPDASVGLSDAITQMVRFELALDHVDAAQALFESLPAVAKEHGLLREQLEARRRENQERASRAMVLEQDRDLSFGAGPRTRAALGLAVGVLALTLGLFVQRLDRPSFQPSTERLAIVGAGILGVMVAVVFAWRRRGAFNLVNRRIAQICVATLALSFVQRVAGHVAGSSAAAVLLTDAFLLTGGGLALSVFHRGGAGLAALSLAVAFAGALEPAIIDELFIGLSVAVPLAALALARWGPKPSENT
ncbi:MAG: serine/threonine protein kinase [Sandaracinaceae bacterium]|nr:serine/threonine protein kinase [Sandaracinaceae bacterium]